MSRQLAPKAPHAEAAALGATLWNLEAARRVTERLRSSDFSRDDYVTVLDTVATILARGERPDLVTVWEALQPLPMKIALLDLEQLVNDVPESARQDPALVDSYVDLILQKSRLRRLIGGCSRAVERARNNGHDAGGILADLFDELRDLEAPRREGPILVRLSDVQSESVSWLWPGRIPVAKLSLLVGDPGLGKSYLTVDLAARISTGRAWPDGEPALLGDVVILTAEDGLADTVRPRLDLLGGDPARVHALTGVGDPEKSGSFNLVRDIVHLEDAVLRTQARLVVIDPLGAYLGETDSHRDSDVRGVLAPLATMAERCRVAVLGIVHLNKSQQRQALYRAQGSLAFVAAARAVFGVAEDQEDPRRRLFIPLKCNLAPKAPGLAFRLDGGRLTWEAGTVDVNADEALGGPEMRAERSEREQAVEFLQEVLANGPVPATDVKRQADEAGISYATLRRARGDLRVVVEKSGFRNGWTWRLPMKMSSVPSLEHHEHLQHLRGGMSTFEDAYPTEDVHQGAHSPEEVNIFRERQE